MEEGARFQVLEAAGGIFTRHRRGGATPGQRVTPVPEPLHLRSSRWTVSTLVVARSAYSEGFRMQRAAGEDTSGPVTRPKSSQACFPVVAACCNSQKWAGLHSEAPQRPHYRACERAGARGRTDSRLRVGWLKVIISPFVRRGLGGDRIFYALRRRRVNGVRRRCHSGSVLFHIIGKRGNQKRVY